MTKHVQHSLRINTYDHLHRRALAFFEEYRLRNTLSILNNDVNQMKGFMNTEFNKFCTWVWYLYFLVLCYLVPHGNWNYLA